jgi:hypothetical protein
VLILCLLAYITVPTLFAAEKYFIPVNLQLDSLPLGKVGPTKRIFDHHIIHLIGRLLPYFLPAVSVAAQPIFGQPKNKHPEDKID